MKTTLRLEQMEDRRTLSASSVEGFDTKNGVSFQGENQITRAEWPVSARIDSQMPKLVMSTAAVDGSIRNAGVRPELSAAFVPPVPVTGTSALSRSTCFAAAASPAQSNRAAGPVASSIMKLPTVRIGGDVNRRLSVVIVSTTGGLWYGGGDRSIQVVYQNGKSRQNPGTMITLSGRTADLNKNLDFIRYSGRDTQVTVRLMSNGKVCNSTTVRLQKA